MPEVQPAELWQESGRWEYYGKELLRFKDRHGHDYCLAPTNEEVITDICRKEIRSYRDMPINLYHFQQKMRDEIRPRFGVMRGRQFCMKDAYTFDVDDEASAVSYRIMYEAYCRIYDRLGLRYKAVEADSGSIGGSFSHEFMVLADTGEDAVVSCTSCDYGANIERAPVIHNGPAEPQGEPGELQKFATPGVHTIDELATLMGNQASDLVKIVIFETDKGEVAAFCRGDHEINPVKVQRAVEAELIDLASGETVQRLTGSPAGSCGPVGIAKGGPAPGRQRPSVLRQLDHRGQRGRLPPQERRARPGLSGPRIPGPAQHPGGRPLPQVRGRGGVFARHRGGPHLPPGRQVLQVHERHLPGPERQVPPHHHGLLRHRGGTDPGRGHRAEPRRARDHPARAGGPPSR